MMRFFKDVHFLFAGLLLASCGGGGDGGGSEANQIVSAPQIPPSLNVSVAGGIYNTDQSIVLTSNASIYFTTDQSTPSNRSARYTQPISISADAVLSFIAIGSNGLSSPVRVETYLIDKIAPSNHSLTSLTSVIDANNQTNFAVSIENGELGANYLIEFNDANAANLALTISGNITSASSLAIEADLSAFADGQITATLVLTDPAGNRAEASTLTLSKTAEQGPFSLNSAVMMAPGTQVDSDVNDITTTSLRNDSFADAQGIFAPGILGGYVNLPNSGASGNTDVSGDEDFFFVELNNNDQIVLTIGDESADLDIELYTSDQTLLDDSLGVGNTETIEVATKGNYFIKVFAFDGASNYVLSVGPRNAQTASFTSSSSFDAFVPNQAIFQLNPQKMQTEAKLQFAEIKAKGLLLAENNISRSQLMKFGDENQRSRMITSRNPEFKLSRIKNYPNSKQKVKQETIWAIKALRKTAGIADAQPNFLRHKYATPNDPLYIEQWHYSHIGLPEAWETSTGKSEVIVAVIDSGILANHPDFENKLVSGYDMISDPASSGDGDGTDADPEDPGDKELGDGSSSFHGTHVAGTIAASTNNDTGVAGVGWQSRVMPIRVLGRDGGTSFDLIQSIRYAAGLENASGAIPDRPADIINMSLGSGGFSAGEADAITAARDAGLIIIAAAGNSGNANPEYPASYDGVVSVAAVNQSNSRTNYSNFGSNIDITAPGGDLDQDADQNGTPDGILSTIGNDRATTKTYGYRYYQGTSMSAPHVAGVAALMKALAENLTPATFDRVLSEGRITDDLGDQGRDDYFGYGLINALKAVNTAQEVASGTLTPLPANLSVSPSNINFGYTQTEQIFSLSNSGEGILTVDSVTENSEWLSIVNNSNNADNLGAYTLTADRANLPPGEASSNISVQSNLGERLIAVSIRISSEDFSEDAGALFALLIDSSNDEVFAQQNLTTPSDASYTIEFSSVPAGEYQLFIGSDMDNDGFICDGGEACGAYPTLNLPENLQIVDNLQITLDISFDQSRFFKQSNSGFLYKQKKKSL